MFNWTVEQACAFGLDDLNELINSQAFKKHQEIEQRKFEALLKTIRQIGGR